MDSKDKITEIQEKNLPKFAIPIIDIDVIRENASIINDYIDRVAEKEARNREIYIICEMAKRYLDSIKKEKCCGTCVWYAEFEGVCCNGSAESRGDFRDNDYACECWEEKTDD